MGVDQLQVELHELAGIFGDAMTADHVGGKFTCGEAETIANVLSLSGHREASHIWLRGHAQGDDPATGDDMHGVCARCDGVVYLAPGDELHFLDLNGRRACGDADKHDVRGYEEDS